jgi:DNA invertase Pin-like site-specific DNA recombinase
VRELQSIGAKKIFREQISSVASRAQLEVAIDFCREGDTLVVCKLDRLARSVRDFRIHRHTRHTEDQGRWAPHLEHEF